MQGLRQVQAGASVKDNYTLCGMLSNRIEFTLERFGGILVVLGLRLRGSTLSCQQFLAMGNVHGLAIEEHT